MTSTKKSRWTQSSKALGTALTILMCCSATETRAGYALDVTEGTSKVWQTDALGYNGKMQGDPWRTDPFDNPNLRDVITRSMIGTFRYPGGTIANYYDWVNGYDNRKLQGHYLTSNLKLAYDDAGFTPTYVVNMLTGTLQEALDGLQQAQNDGLPVTLVELGNEFYLSDADYVNKYPSGTEYGQECQTWITAIKSQFPGVKCAVVVTMKVGTRNSTWSDEVLSACSNYDSVIVHWYEQSGLEPAVVTGNGTQNEQDTQWAAFTGTDGVKIMLSKPNHGWNLLRSQNNLPSNVDIWVTEFNLKDSNGAVRQTWANGLFNANQIHAFLQDGRVSRIYHHNWLSSNKQAIFGLNNELDHVLTNHGQGDLTTTPYEFGAPGQVVKLFAEVMTGSDAIAPLSFETSPKVTPPGYDAYDALYGWKFMEGASERAILVNTSDTAYEIKTANIAPAGSHMRKLSGNPITYVTGENDTLNYATAGEMPPVLRVPAYGIITIGGPVDDAPSGTPANAPSFSADPISKPTATAYEYYTQSLVGDASDPDGDALTYSKISGPAWITVWSDGTLAGTAYNSDAGLNQVVVKVTDSSGLTDQATVEFTVNAGTPPPPPPIAPRTYSAAEDTFVFSGSQADIVQSLDAQLDIRSTASATFSRVPYIKFDIDELPGTISNAVLNVYSIDLNAQVITYETAAVWSQSTITWNNQPGFGTPIATNTMAVGWNQIDVTDLIAGIGTYSLALDEQNNSGRFYLSSSRGSNPPYIEITFASAAGNNPPVFSADPLNKSAATEDAAYSDTISGSASDADGDALTYSKVSGPAWLSVASSGALSGTPVQGDVGANVFTVQVADGNGGSDAATLNITVNNVNDAPAFTVDPINKPAATEDAAYSDTINGSATDEDSDPLTYAKVSGPAWLSVASSGALSGTPVQGDVGANVFTVQVADGNGGSDTATLNITVNNVNDAPVFTVDPINKPAATEDAAYSDSINGSATDEDSDPLTYAKVSGSAWLSVASDGTLSGTPGAGDLGTNVFSVAVFDGIVSNTASLEIMVFSIYEGWASAYNLNGSNAEFSSDPDGDGLNNLAEYALGGNPNDNNSAIRPESSLTLDSGSWWIEYCYRRRTDAAARGLTYYLELTDDLNGSWSTNGYSETGTAPVDTGFEMVTNRIDTLTDSRFVQLKVAAAAPANQPPAFTADPITEVNATESAAYNASIADNASDPESDPMTFSKVSGPAWLSVASDGTLSGTPGVGDVGPNSFTVQVDATGGSDTATLNITVDAVPIVWTEILYDDFEGGFGNWIDGGADCSLYTGGLLAHQGSNAVNLQDNTETSVMSTSNQALSGNTEVRVDFWAYPSSFEGTEDFWLQISTNGGSSYTTVKAWVNGVDFSNDTFFSDSVVISGITLTDQTRLRFRCDASGNNDNIYIDEVRVLIQ
jgi:hypothetical protein